MHATTTLIRSRDDGQATWFFNALMTTKAAMSETAGAYSLTEHLVTAASNPPMHVQVDEDDVADEVGSLSQSAEALRLTAAAPQRNNNAGADYDG